MQNSQVLRRPQDDSDGVVVIIFFVEETLPGCHSMFAERPPAVILCLHNDLPRLSS
jgi:hypothetical protein